MEDHQIKILVNKYLEGTATEQEAALVEEWYLKFKDAARPEITHLFIESSTDRVWKRLEQQQGLPEDKKAIRLAGRINSIAAAAAIVLVVFGGLFYYYNSKVSSHLPSLVSQNDIAPGANKATLTLANGKKISLTDAKNGTLVRQPGIRISKTANGQLIYEVEDAGKNSGGREISYNKIETPRGGQYQVSLPDGTKVWLNASSSFSYPATFAGQDERKVELTGEAYFEVAKDRLHPFKVKSLGQEIEVLGTHFNINAYADEPDVKTALLEGSIKVTAGASAVVIKPGQEASFKGSKINVEDVNADAVADWKNGKFRFKNEPLTSILRKVSRWYDVQIVYSQDLKNIPTFSGAVSRFDHVSAVLKMLEETSDVKFSIEGKTIKVK